MKTATIEKAKEYVGRYLAGQNYDVDVRGNGWYGEFDSYYIPIVDCKVFNLDKWRYDTPLSSKRVLIFSIPIPESEDKLLEILKLIDKQ